MKLRNHAVVLLLFALLCVSPSKAQYVDVIHGTATEEEVILDTKHIANGETINVGCVYWNNNPNSDNADALITKVDAAGTTIWSRRLATPLKDRLCRVIVAANGDYIACGYTTEVILVNGMSVYQRKGLLCRFNPSGTVFWTREWQAPVPGAYATDQGPVFNGLCETSNGSIAVAGSINACRPGSDGLVALFNNVGNQIWAESFANPQSDHFRDIIEYQGELIVVGPREDGTNSYDGALVRLNPFTGAHIWSYGYSLNYSYFPSASAPPINLNCVWLSSLHIVGGVLHTSGAVSSDWVGAMLGDNSLLLRFSAFGFNATPIVASNPPHAFSNGAFFVPMSNTEFIIGQNPGSAQFHYEAMNQPAYDYVLTYLNGSTPTSVGPNTVGQKSLFTAAIDVPSNHVHAAGLARNGTFQIGQDDMINEYYSIPFSDSPDKCDKTIPTVNISSPAVERNDISWVTTFKPLIENNTVQVVSPTFLVMSPCDSTVTDPPGGETCDTCCVDTCYWTVNGNNINANKNIFGTLSKDDIRIFTNNLHRGTITEDGKWGIEQTAPSTTLHVECAAIPGQLSGLRLEHLPVGSGDILTVDADGYVRRLSPSGQKELNEGIQKEVDELKKEIAELKQLLGKGDNSGVNSDAGATLTVSPNPTDGEITATYSLTKSFSTGEIRISDASGKILMTKELTKGNNYGNVKMVLPKNISSEQLICTLVCDGKIIASQKLLLLHK